MLKIQSFNLELVIQKKTQDDTLFLKKIYQLNQ